MISDFGIILELIGFVLFLFYKKDEPDVMGLEMDRKIIKCILGDTIENFATKHPKLSTNFLPFGVFFICIGLILQSELVNNLFIECFSDLQI